MDVENMDVDGPPASIDTADLNALLTYTTPSLSNDVHVHPFAAPALLPHHTSAVAGPSRALLPHLLLAGGSQAAFAPTVPDPQPSIAGPSVAFDRSQNAPSPSPPDSRSWANLALNLNPMENLRDYALHAFVPPISETHPLGIYLNQRIFHLCKRDVNRPNRHFDIDKDVRNDEDKLVGDIAPTGGERRLVEIIRIDDSQILQAASDWNVGARSPIPSNVDLHQLYRSRPDLFHTYWPERDPSIVPSSPAPSDTTEPELEEEPTKLRAQLSASTAVHYARSMVAEDGDPVTPEEYDPAVRVWDHHPNAYPGHSREPAPSLKDNIIAFTLPASGYSVNKVSDLSPPRVVVKKESFESTAWTKSSASLFNGHDDDGDDTDEEDSAPPSPTPRRTFGRSGPSGLGSVRDLRVGLQESLAAASFLLTPKASKEQRVAALLQQTLLVTASSLLHVSATADQLTGWQWLDRNEAESVAARTRMSVQTAFAVDGWEAFVWGRKPTTTRGIEPVKVQQGWMAGIPRPEHKNGKLGMLFVTLPPWALTLKTFCDFSQMQEFTDGVRGEPAFYNFEALWAAIYDSCKEMGVNYFAVSSYDHIALGCFTADWQSAYISQPYSTTPPLPTDPRNPISPTTMPPLDDSVASGPRKPNALQLLSYWMLSSVGTFPGVWSIPSEAGPVGPLGLSSKRGAFELRETLWPFRSDGEFVHPEVAEAVAQLGEDESTYLLTRRAQMSQALDLRDYVQWDKNGRRPQPIPPTHLGEEDDRKSVLPDEVEEGYKPGSHHGESVIVGFAAEDDNHQDVAHNAVAGPSSSVTPALSTSGTLSIKEFIALYQFEYHSNTTGYDYFSHPMLEGLHFKVGGHWVPDGRPCGSAGSEAEVELAMKEGSSGDDSELPTPLNGMPPTPPPEGHPWMMEGKGKAVAFDYPASDCDMQDVEFEDEDQTEDRLLVSSPVEYPRTRSRSAAPRPAVPRPTIALTLTPLRRTIRNIIAPERFVSENKSSPVQPRAKSRAPSVMPTSTRKKRGRETEEPADEQGAPAATSDRPMKKSRKFNPPPPPPVAHRRTTRGVSMKPF